MNKFSTTIAATLLVAASSTATADNGAPALLAGLADNDISVIDAAAQQELRGEYINGSSWALAIKQYLHCSKSYIRCYGTQYVSPTERFIRFAFRSTPYKVEYKSY